MKHSVQVEVGGRPMVFRSRGDCPPGRRFRAHALRRHGGAYCCSTKEGSRFGEGIDFVPLMVGLSGDEYAAGAESRAVLPP